MMCAGGIQGYLLNSSAVDLVLKPVVQCAMNPDCIAIPGAGTQNHRFAIHYRFKLIKEGLTNPHFPS
jgi:hypothetical protein